jgi:hypothetical protein
MEVKKQIQGRLHVVCRSSLYDLKNADMVVCLRGSKMLLKAVTFEHVTTTRIIMRGSSLSYDKAKLAQATDI